MRLFWSFVSHQRAALKEEFFICSFRNITQLAVFCCVYFSIPKSTARSKIILLKPGKLKKKKKKDKLLWRSTGLGRIFWLESYFKDRDCFVWQTVCSYGCLVKDNKFAFFLFCSRTKKKYINIHASSTYQLNRVFKKRKKKSLFLVKVLRWNDVMHFNGPSHHCSPHPIKSGFPGTILYFFRIQFEERD